MHIRTSTIETVPQDQVTVSTYRAAFLQGPPKVWVEQLAEFAIAERVSAFFLCRLNSPDALRRFAVEVAPAVRELVANG